MSRPDKRLSIVGAAVAATNCVSRRKFNKFTAPIAGMTTEDTVSAEKSLTCAMKAAEIGHGERRTSAGEENLGAKTMLTVPEGTLAAKPANEKGSGGDSCLPKDKGQIDDKKHGGGRGEQLGPYSSWRSPVLAGNQLDKGQPSSSWPRGPLTYPFHLNTGGGLMAIPAYFPKPAKGK
jgi:hypothetical protein